MRRYVPTHPLQVFVAVWNEAPFYMLQEMLHKTHPARQYRDTPRSKLTFGLVGRSKDNLYEPRKSSFHETVCRWY